MPSRWEMARTRRAGTPSMRSAPVFGCRWDMKRSGPATCKEQTVQASRLLPGGAMERREILGCPFDPVTMERAVERCESFIRSGDPHRVVVVNAAKIVKM